MSDPETKRKTTRLLGAGARNSLCLGLVAGVLGVREFVHGSCFWAIPFGVTAVGLFFSMWRFRRESR